MRRDDQSSFGSRMIAVTALLTASIFTVPATAQDGDGSASMPVREPVPAFTHPAAPSDGALGATLNVEGGADRLAFGPTFIDDDGNIHEPNIEAIAAAGITQGCNPPTNDRFCPTAAVTRAEMATMLVRALGEAAGLPPYQGFFPDVPAGQWFTGYVERAAQLGLTAGYGDGTFRPAAFVSRSEMAALVLRAIGEQSEAAVHAGVFADVSGDEWFAHFVEKLHEVGITSGCATDPLRYCPHAAVRRDEMATFVARAFALLPPADRFEIVFDGMTVSQGTAHSVDAALTAAEAWMGERFGTLQDPVPVYVSSDTSWLAARWSELTGEQATAGLFAGDVACIAGAPGAIWCTDLLARPEVAAHELFHVFQVRWSQAVHPSEQALDPRWLIEGTATYVQARYGADVRGDSWPAVRQTFIDRANTSSTPLPDLTTWEGYAAGDFSASVSFAAADLLVTTHGEAALRHYFETLSFSSPDQAFNQAFNMSVADFYIEFEEARKSGFPGSA